MLKNIFTELAFLYLFTIIVAYLVFAVLAASFNIFLWPLLLRIAFGWLLLQGFGMALFFMVLEIDFYTNKKTLKAKMFKNYYTAILLCAGIYLIGINYDQTGQYNNAMQWQIAITFSLLIAALHQMLKPIKKQNE